MSIDIPLEQQRLRAAEASCGISSDVIYKRILAIIAERNLGGCVLDYGAGIGNFTRQLSSSKCFDRIAGADIMPRPEDLPSSIAWLHLDLNSHIPVPSSEYDVVLAIEVIEHLENPREVARDLHRLLKPGGSLILSTPNNESLRSMIALLLRGHFVAFSDSCYPAHITALLRKDLQRILAECGFRNVEFTYTHSGGLPGKPTWSWQRVSGGLLGGLRFTDNVICVATK